MTTVIRLEGYTAPERDTGTWTGVRIERAPTYAGPWPGTVLRADPVAYLDPKVPPTLSWTFVDPDDSGWYRAVWTAPPGEEAPTHPVQGGEWSPDWPSVGEVALVLRARLVELGGHRVETFTSETRPTAEEVAALIGLYAPLTLTGFGDLSTLGCGGASTLRGAARALIASRVATEIEYSFRPEEVGESAAVAAAERRAQHDADVTRLQAAVDRCREEGSTSDPGAGGDGTSTGRSDPAWLFNRPPLLNW
jgi:hypothetical protein